MKKFIIAAIAIVAFTANTFAADNNDKTISLFKAAYPNATNVHYKLLGEMVSISFVVNNSSMQAFYNTDGEQVAVSRETSINRLPARAITTLNSKYPGYTTTEVIEMEHNTEGTSYYVSLEKNNKKVIAQVSIEGTVNLFKKYNK